MEENDLCILILRLSELLTTFTGRSLWGRQKLLFYGPCAFDEVANRQNPVRLTSAGWCRQGGSRSTDIIDSAKSVTIETLVTVEPKASVTIALYFPMIIYFWFD